MSPKTLKWVRFIVPAVMLYCFLAAVCWFSHWCELELPTQYAEFSKSIAAIVLGYIYTVSPLRKIANRDYHAAVNRNLMEKISGAFATDPSVPNNLPWSTVRPVFYWFVDNDASLKHQASLAYWNGAFWTSSADLRAISCLACVATALLMLFANIFGDLHFDNARATYFFLLAVFLFLMSIVASKLTTRRHVEIGNEQCEFILVNYRAQLRDRLRGVGQ